MSANLEFTKGIFLVEDVDLLLWLSVIFLSVLALWIDRCECIDSAARHALDVEQRICVDYEKRRDDEKTDACEDLEEQGLNCESCEDDSEEEKAEEDFHVDENRVLMLLMDVFELIVVCESCDWQTDVEDGGRVTVLLNVKTLLEFSEFSSSSSTRASGAA